jgi:hypothetical protein
MAAVGLSLFFAFTAPERGRAALWRLAASGAALAPAVYNKPMLALLGLAPLVLVLRRRNWRALAAYVAASALALASIAGLAVLLTDHPTPYLGVKRQGVTVCEAGVVPIRPGPGGGAAPDAERPTGGAWSWVFRFPRTGLEMLPANLGYFLVGRHTGLFVYFPFALVALLLFALQPRRGPERWALLASLGLVALAFLLLIPRNWQGGGGFIGNRYYVNAYPAFLFLVRAVRPRALVAAGYAAGGLLLGFLLLSPFARGGPEPTLQSHVRNFPFPLLPLERTLREVPGYTTADLGPVRLVGRSDQLLAFGDVVWLRGADRSELWLRSPQPLAETVWWLRSPAPGNRVRLELGEAEAELELSPGDGQRVTLAPGRGEGGGEEGPVEYRMELAASGGRIRPWTRAMPPASCPGAFAWQPSYQEDFFVGVELVLLGTAEDLAADVYAARLEPARVPRQVRPGVRGELAVAVTNTSRVTWRAGGAARVRLASRWLGPGGEVVAEGERAELPLPLAPGERATVQLPLAAPAAEGSYRLRLEPVFEHVGWFADRDPTAAVTVPVEVAARPAAKRPAAGAADGAGGGDG